MRSDLIADRLFLYGTLLSAIDTPMARWLSPRLGEGREASVRGRLVAIPASGGYYPALLPAVDHRRVAGMVFDAVLSPADWRMLDLYEGREYRREAVRVSVPGGQRRACCYCWTGSLPPAARPIRGGDFAEWLARHRLRAFGADQTVS